MASKMLLIVVFIFDAIAFGLAIVAELRRSTAIVVADEEMDHAYCVYDSGISSTRYGIGASVCLLWSQIIVTSAASRSFFRGEALKPGSSSSSRTREVVLFVICWVLFVVAQVCLIAGSVRNAYRTKYRSLLVAGEDPPSCVTLRKGVFAAGAGFIFLNLIVSELYYVSISKARDSVQPNDGEVAVDTGIEK